MNIVFDRSLHWSQMEKANTKPDVCIRFYHEVKNFHTIINYCVIKFKKEY